VKDLTTKEANIKKIEGDSGDIEFENARLKAIAEDALLSLKRKNELSHEKQLQDVSQILLKDNGIKTAIIREYLPVLNKLINKYLQSFDFFVNFNLDESFSEVIKSRGRDEFSYASFSEGEKKRLDLAILLAFRQIAAMKNSAKVNLIIFDEVVDSSLDLEARAKFNELLESMQDSNVFVISHTDTQPDSYASVIKVEKKGDFSTYSYV
jgi:DNA repair exonuclease SbcCD ATPase subunit